MHFDLKTEVKSLGKYLMHDAIETRRKIQAILEDTDFPSFLAGFSAFAVLYGLILQVVEAGKTELLKKKLNTEFKKIGELLKQRPELREDPNVKRLLELSKDVLEGRTDPKIVDALEAVKQKFEVA